MVPHSPPAVTPPPVFRTDLETLDRLASMPSKLLDLNVCPTLTSLRQFCGATDKPKPAWFWGPNQETVAVILMPESPNQSCRLFEARLEKTVTTGFESKPANTVTACFEAKPLETVATSFEAKPTKTVQVDLRPNHSQTVDLGFAAHPRNPRSSSPCARCRLHTVPPDLSTARPPCTRLVLFTRSPTPTTVLIAARHAAPATYTPRDKQT
jgi:hypothetical protein